MSSPEVPQQPRRAASGEVPIHPHLAVRAGSDRSRSSHSGLTDNVIVSPLDSPSYDEIVDLHDVGPPPPATYNFGIDPQSLHASPAESYDDDDSTLAYTPSDYQNDLTMLLPSLNGPTLHDGLQASSPFTLAAYRNDLENLLNDQQWNPHPAQRQLETEILKRERLERQVGSLKHENDELNKTLKIYSNILFQRNSEWLQLFEENRALRDGSQPMLQNRASSRPMPLNVNERSTKKGF